MSVSLHCEQLIILYRLRAQTTSVKRGMRSVEWFCWCSCLQHSTSVHDASNRRTSTVIPHCLPVRLCCSHRFECFSRI